MISLLAVGLISSVSLAQVSVNPHEDGTVFDESIDLLSKVVDTVGFNGVYTGFTDGDYGAGMAVQVKLLKINIKNTELAFGPSYVLVFARESVKNAAGVSLSTQIINAEKAQEKFSRIPLLGKIFNISDIQTFVGVGVQVDRPDNIALSIGLGGIKFGN